MKAQHPPAAPSGDQGRTNLITETERCNDVLISQTRVTVSLGSPIERSDGICAISEGGELVHVTLAVFIIEKEWRHRSERLFRHGGGEQQGRWVHRGKERGIDRNNGSQSAKYVLTEFGGTVSEIAAPDDLAKLTFCYLNGHVHQGYA